MMASASGVLYTGVTNHLERRVAEHQSKHTPEFSSRYNTTKLVYFEPFSDIRNAIAREKQWKTWRRDKKVVLIERPQSPMARPKRRFQPLSVSKSNSSSTEPFQI
jgi:putative endonuclease